MQVLMFSNCQINITLTFAKFLSKDGFNSHILINKEEKKFNKEEKKIDEDGNPRKLTGKGLKING